MASSTAPPTEGSRKLLKFSLRDLLWLILVVGLGLGWGLDQVRIRREREALRLERESIRLAVGQLQSLPLRVAEKKLAVCEAELASLLEIKQKHPGAVPGNEIRRAELTVQLARLEVEKARASEEHGTTTQPVKSLNSK